MTELDKIPDWIKGVLTALGGAAFWNAILKYKSEAKGHEVTAEHNADQHDEKMSDLAIGVLQNQIDRLDAEMKEVKAANAELTKENLGLQKEQVKLLASHAKCETDMQVMAGKVDSLEKQLEKLEAQRLNEIRDLKEDNLGLRGLYEAAKSALSEHDILTRVEGNERAIEEMKAVTQPETVHLQAETVKINAAVAIESGGAEKEEG